jgi:hypothetical protein
MRKLYGAAGAAAVMGVLMFGTLGVASASASSWWVGGTELTSSAPFASSTNTLRTVTMKFNTITIECTGVELKSADLVGQSGGQIEHLVLTGCHMQGSGGCSLRNTKIESKPLKMEPALYEKSPEDKVVLKPVTGKLFMEISVGGASCGHPEEGAEIEGQMTLALPTGREELAEQELEFITLAAGELHGWIGSWTLGGDVKAKLASGKSWSFH